MLQSLTRAFLQTKRVIIKTMKVKIIQISAGKGPLESAFVVAKVLKIFLKELVSDKIEYAILHKENGIENGTVQSVSIQIKGNNLADFTANWLGTIQWIGTSTFRKYHKRKNWFIGCFEIENSEFLEIKENEIQFQAIRSSGAGGQHVNKVETAVNITHIPTGITVQASEERSQFLNKKLAFARLDIAIKAQNQKQQEVMQKQKWMQHKQLQRGNPVQVFKK